MKSRKMVSKQVQDQTEKQQCGTIKIKIVKIETKMYSTGRYVSHSESTRKKHKTEKTSYNT